MKCFTAVGDTVIIADYSCMSGTIDVMSAYSGLRVLQLDGTCATWYNRHGKTNSFINWNCQEWPNRVFQNGPGVPY